MSLASGCSDDFVPATRLASLRVLGISGEPAAPAMNERTTLSVLVFTPNDEPVTYEWRWCPLPGPARDGYPCLITEAELAAMANISPPPFILGTDATATFTNTLPPELLRPFCRTDQNVLAPLDCEGGFPVQVRVIVTTADDQIDAITTLRLRFDPGIPPNANPSVDGITAMIDGNEVAITDDPDPMVTLRRDRETEMRVGLTLDDAEPYNGLDENRKSQDMRERLRISWFVESGGIDNDRTAFIERPLGTVLEPIDDARKNKWTPGNLEAYPGDTARIVVVVRDNRGGTGWVRGRVRLRDAQ